MSEMRCRGCGSDSIAPVLTLDGVPPADLFPPAESPVDPDESAHVLQMAVCRDCALAQLVTDDTTAEEPLGVEPAALVRQSQDAIDLLVRQGVLRAGQTVAEFRSPHGGQWAPQTLRHGLLPGGAGTGPADVVFDSFGMMHDADQRAAAVARAARVDADGVLLLQFHSIATIVTQSQWMSLRHGHYAYYSLTALRRLFDSVGMSITDAWEFPLYGGSVLVAIRHGTSLPMSDTVAAIADGEDRLGVTAPEGFAGLADSVATTLRRVRDHVDSVGSQGLTCAAYGAASRAVAIFGLAGLTRDQVDAVADVSPSKRGRRMPGTDIPIISPDDLVVRHPDSVWLTLPDLLPEVSAAYPSLADRFVDLG